MLWLKYAEEMKVGDIAQVLGKTQTHVKVLLFRARQTLGRALKAARGSGLPSGGAAARVTPDRAAAPTLLTGDGRGSGAGCVIGCAEMLAGSGPRGTRKGPL